MSDTVPLFTYKITSTPETMQAGKPVTLSINVSNSGSRAIECKSIRFDFQKGNSSQALFSDDTGITPVASSADWKIQQHGASFIATPKSGTANIASPLTFDLKDVAVNNQPGFVELIITEETGAGRTASKKISIGKFPAGQTTLLTYEVSHTPDPIQASPSEGDGPETSLTIVVSNSTHQSIDCRSISFDFLAGSNAKDFFEATDAARIQTSVPAGWSISHSDSVFTATPDNGSKSIAGAGFQFEFSHIKVNQQVGTTDLTITEITGPGPNTATMVIPLAKFPLDFEVSDLTVDHANVTAGDNVTLSWIGSSDAAYELEYVDDEGKLIKVPEKSTDPPLAAHGSYTIENLQTAGAQTTEVDFTLNVTRSGSGDSPPTLQRQCTVTIAPSLPRVNYFKGVSLDPRASKVFVKWDASNADSCRLVDGNFDPTSDKHRIDFEDDDPASKTFTLTALDLTKKHHDSLDLIVNWRLGEVQSTAVAPAGSSTYGLAVAASEDRIFVSYADAEGGGDGWLWILDSRTLDRIDSIGVGASSLAMSPNQQRLYGVYGSELFYLSPDTHQREVTMLGSVVSYFGHIAVSADNNCVFATGGSGARYETDDRHLQVIMPEFYSPTPPMESEVNAHVISMAASPLNSPINGVYQPVYVGCSDQTLRIYTGNPMYMVGDPLPLSGVPVGIACSPDGKIIYVVTSDRKLFALNADTFTPFADPTPLQADPTAIAVAPNAEHLYITTKDGNLRKLLAYTFFNPVKIVSFTATPKQFKTGDNTNSFRAKLSWEAVSATEVLLNGEVITGASKDVWVDKTTEFKLKAKGGSGPVSQVQTVEVIRLVKIDHFTASAVRLYRVGSNVDVTLDWAVRNAETVTLSGDVVSASGSKTVSLHQTTTFTLAATGVDGPATSDVTIMLKEINLVVSRSSSAILASFSADAGTYSVKFVLHYQEMLGGIFYDRSEESTVVVTSTGDSQTLSAQAPCLPDRFPEVYCAEAEVTVTGLPWGPVSAKLGQTTG